MSKIALASDHAGFLFKESVKKFLESKSLKYKDFGTYSQDIVDYPDYVHPACKALENKECELGILFCGSGNGVSITANKYKNIRSAVCWAPEISTLARQHNDSNVISIPCRFIDESVLYQIVNNFLNTKFDGGRHQIRVNKINC